MCEHVDEISVQEITSKRITIYLPHVIWHLFIHSSKYRSAGIFTHGASPKNCKEFGSPAMSSPRPRLPSQGVVRRCSLAFPYKSVSWPRPPERWLATLLPELSAQLREGFLSSPGPAFSQSYRPTERHRSRRLASLPLFARLESSQLETNRAASMQ